MPTDELRNSLALACERAGLSSADAQLIHYYATAIWLLPRDQVIVRMGYSGRHEHAQAATTLCRWLVNRGFPAAAPVRSEVVTVGKRITASFWRYYRQPNGMKPDSKDVARLLSQLHQMSTPPVRLPDWQPFASLEPLLRDYDRSPSLSHGEREELLERVDQLKWHLTRVPSQLGYGLIHGDAWAGNILWDAPSKTAEPLLTDWDSVSYGPREVDLIPTWHAATRYMSAEEGGRWIGRFVDEYGHDIADWSGFAHLFAWRDLIQLVGPLRHADRESSFAVALRQRLAGILNGDTTTIWRSY